jgi:hypothetical protein
MFRLFYRTNDVTTTPKEVESDESEADDDEEGECDVTDFVLGKPLYTRIVFDDTVFTKHVCDFRKICPNVLNWAYNRNMDLLHVDRILCGLKDMKCPHLVGSIKVVKDGITNTLTVLDGQHRVMALLKLMGECPHINMDIEVDVYHISDVTKDDIEIKELFLKANNNKNVSIDDLPETKVIKVIDGMIEIWPKCIKTRDDQVTAYKPNITKRELYTVMKKHFHDTPTLAVKSSGEILKAIVTINTNMRTKPLKELFGRETPSRKKISMYEKAMKHDFFLNLDCKIGLTVWLSMLK